MMFSNLDVYTLLNMVECSIIHSENNELTVKSNKEAISIHRNLLYLSKKYAKFCKGNPDYIIKMLIIKSEIRGDIYHELNGRFHNINGEPAVICASGTYWYKLGVRHRDNDEPAIITTDGTRYWYQNGELHRDSDEPAIIDADGTREWYKNGKKHRDNDEPSVIWANGSLHWYKLGERHRDNDESAVIIVDGSRHWYKNGTFIKYSRT
jgi:hypothetical protein